MRTIKELTKAYESKVDYLDLEIIISRAINKSREFVLTHPEKKLTSNQESRIINHISRRIKHEPLAYILGSKEFYGLDFKVNKNTLIPRPETELLVDETVKLFSNLLSNNFSNTALIDIGTGSGNIIISIVKNLNKKINYFATDISGKALRTAKQNAKNNKVGRKIKFLRGNLLQPLLKIKKLTKLNPKKLVIVANLPYLSEKIYKSSPDSVREYEPKSALLSSKDGLSHYEKLFRQIKLLATGYLPRRQAGGLLITIILEISPEQKNKIDKLAKQYFPKAEIRFKKDLAGEWRICEIEA